MGFGVSCGMIPFVDVDRDGERSGSAVAMMTTRVWGGFDARYGGSLCVQWGPSSSCPTSTRCWGLVTTNLKLVVTRLRNEFLLEICSDGGWFCERTAFRTFDIANLQRRGINKTSRGAGVVAAPGKLN